MNHDDGNKANEIKKSDIVLLGVSRTSKTPTSIYLANRGFKTSNIPLVNEKSVPEFLTKNPKSLCVIGLTTEPTRLYDLRRNRMNTLKETEKINYVDMEHITKEVNQALKTFKKYEWPVIDVTRKSVEETFTLLLKFTKYRKNV